jgi:hypothetical protein
MDISEGRFAALMRTADVGMWVAVGGFLAAGVGAAIAPLRVGLAPASS